MTETTVKQINDLKEELRRQMASIRDISELVKQNIDRDFHLDLWDLSERELDSEMGERLTFLNDDIHLHPENFPLPEGGVKAKAKGFLKKLVARTVRLYTDRIFERQIRFNEQATAFHLATFIRLHHKKKTHRDHRR